MKRLRGLGPHGLGIGVGAMLFTCFVSAATLTVDPSGAGDYSEIQPAIDAASRGDVVLVKPGEYVISEPIDSTLR